MVMDYQAALRLARDPPLEVLAGVLTVIITVHLLVERHLFRRDPVPRRDTPFLAGVNRVNALAYSIFSAISFFYCVYSLIELFQQSKPGFRVYKLLYCGDFRVHRLRTALIIYFWAKLWEGLLDLNLVTLRGIPIHIHFRLHHYTTPIFAWLGLATGSAHGFTFMLLNLWMHICVYAWHGGVRLPALHRFIRLFQYVQLFGGIAVCALAFVGRLSGASCTAADGLLGWAADTIPALLFYMYYRLFLIELRDFDAELKRKPE